MKVMRNGVWVDLEKDNARLAALAKARDERRARELRAVQEEVQRVVTGIRAAARDRMFGRAVRQVAREAGFPDEIIDRGWPLIYGLAEADLMNDDERERWIAEGMPLDERTPSPGRIEHPFPDEA